MRRRLQPRARAMRTRRPRLPRAKLTKLRKPPLPMARAATSPRKHLLPKARARSRKKPRLKKALSLPRPKAGNSAQAESRARNPGGPVRSDGHDEHLYVSGGFLEVLPDRVVILADAAERAEDIDEARAEEARRRAQELLAEEPGNDEAAAQLESALFRIKVAEIRRRRHGDRRGGAPPSQ